MTGEDFKSRFRTAFFVIAACSLLGAVGCTSTNSSNSGQEKTANAASPDPGAHVDIMCVGDRINDPTEAFHYSFKFSDGAMSEEDEADITPQTLDITVKDQSGSHSYHAVRSDETGWGSAVLTVSSLGMTAMSARLDSLNGTSSLKPQGMENINGYATTKYAIDTTKANAADQSQYEQLFGKGSFQKGTIWMAGDSCAAKLLLDEGIWQQDSSIKKQHFEIARIKK